MRRAATLLVLTLWAGSVAAQGRPTPAGLDALVARGDSAWAREDRAAAFRAYDAVVQADSAYSARALFRVGQLHAWANRFARAIAAQRRYVQQERDDLDGRVALGRTYAWSARYAASIAAYDSVLSRDPAYRDAVLGRAQALAWSGRIATAESALERWLERRDDDVEAWALLGQFRRWRGALGSAEDALRRAVALAPEHSGAREQLAWVQSELDVSLQWQLVGAKDSEDNTLWHRELGLARSTRGGLRYGVAARLREASVTDVGAVVVPGAAAHAQWRPPAMPITWRGEIGAVSFPASLSPATTRLRGGLRGSGAFAQRLRVSAGGSLEPFDEVRATAQRAVMLSTLDVDANVTVHPQWQVEAAASLAVADGEGVSQARRRTALAGLRYLPRRGVQAALQHRAVSWNAPQFGIFFAPQTWTTTELALGWERAAELGLVLAGDAAIGAQRVGFESTAAQRSTAPRAALRAGWRVAPGRELLLGLVYANVAGAGAVSADDYRYGAATLSARWTF